MDLALAQPLTLKCGLQIKNRLVKAAMAEGMADKSGLPTEQFDKAYEEWGRGGWGMILTGNVQVDRAHLGMAEDITVNLDKEEDLVRTWKSWAAACSRHGTPTIMQINHPGRQSPLGAGSRGICAKSIAPSAIPMKMGTSIVAKLANALVFGTPREMTQADIDTVVQQFAQTSRLAAQAGFHGVEIHGAHGYLLAQFLSAKSNHRTDAYGGSAAARAKIVVEVIRAIRAAVPENFCVGIKLNSVDHQSAEELKNCVEQLKQIVDAGVDFLEISGGSYEDPTMLQSTSEPATEKSERTIAREAFFLEFARAIRGEFPSVPLMVTGGFRTRAGMNKAVAEGACDMAGLGRPAVLHPTSPNDVILNPKVSDEDARLETEAVKTPWIVFLTGIKAIGSGAESLWYSKRIQKMGASL